MGSRELPKSTQQEHGWPGNKLSEEADHSGSEHIAKHKKEELEPGLNTISALICMESHIAEAGLKLVI